MFRRNRTRNGGGHRGGHHSAPKPKKSVTPVVGTEAAAKQHMERNRREFKYPADAVFETPIEHSLLYNMLKEPEIYPRDVLVQHINEEDFTQYMYYTLTKKIFDPNINDTNNDSHNNDSMVSYAQLSALLGLSAEHYPQINNQHQPGSEYGVRVSNPETEKKLEEEREKKDVSKILGKRILQTVIKYATENELDRESEVNELLEPFAKYVQKRNINAELKAIGALYAGYTATLVTANPLPALAGLAVWSTAITSRENEMQNFNTMQTESNRRANVETAGLLDEVE